MNDVVFQFDADALIDAIEEASTIAVLDAVQFTALNLRQRIPQERVVTRRNVVAFADGTAGYSGIAFPSGHQFQTRGTNTEKIVSQSWRAIENVVATRLYETIKHQIKEQT